MPAIYRMPGCFIIYIMVMELISEAMGVLVNSPCKGTADWSDYNIRCPANHIIYIRKHVIENAFNTLVFPALGCSASHSLNCGVELPINNTINRKNYDIFESAVNTCNGQNECTLTKEYFVDSEMALKKYCNASIRPEIQRAPFRQSIEYKCIQDFQIIDMCSTEDNTCSSHSDQPVYLKASGTGCSCNVTGFVSRVEILQAISVKLLIHSNASNVFEHQNTDVGLYGVDISVQAENLTIEIKEGSNKGLSLMKVLSKGNLIIHCDSYQISLSTYETLRRQFQIEKTSWTSFSTPAKPNMYIESTRNDQVHVHDDVLSWIQTFFIIILLVFASFSWYKKRTEGRNTIKIRLIDREEKLSFMCCSKDEKKKTSIEIHQADCMCEATNKQHVTNSTYTPLDVLNEVENNNQSNSNNEYLDVV